MHHGCEYTLTEALCVVQILNDSEARFNSADLNIAYKMDVEEYKRLCPYSQSLEANWGKAPGMSHAEWDQQLPWITVPAPCRYLRCFQL